MQSKLRERVPNWEMHMYRRCVLMTDVAQTYVNARWRGDLRSKGNISRGAYVCPFRFIRYGGGELGDV